MFTYIYTFVSRSLVLWARHFFFGTTIFNYAFFLVAILVLFFIDAWRDMNKYDESYTNSEVHRGSVAMLYTVQEKLKSYQFLIFKKKVSMNVA